MNFVTPICLAVLVNCALGQFLYEDDPCRTNAGVRGICKLASNCPSAIKNQRVTGRPTLCGFEGSVPIVCCTDNANAGSNNGNFNPPPPRPTPPSRIPSRKSVEKCLQYSRAVIQEFTAVPLLPDPDPLTITTPKCIHTSTPLIVGGEEASIGEFPHMAAIGFRDSGSDLYLFDCGGTLISENYVLTAAHCTYNRAYGEPVRVRLGDHDIRSNEDNVTVQDIDIQSIIPYPDYKFPSKYHDIALIRLSTPARFNNEVRPACLWTSENINSENALATGWGELLPKSGLRPSVLQKVTLNVIPQSQCAALPALAPSQPRGGIIRGLIREQMCAGDLRKGGKDTCQGDSGGPLQVTNPNNRCIFYVIGVTSFGTGCGEAKSPGIYTRVSAYLDWIERTVWPN